MNNKEFVAWRKRMKLTILELARELDVEPSTIHRYNNLENKEISRAIELALETIERNLQNPKSKEIIEIEVSSTKPLALALKEFGEKIKKFREDNDLLQNQIISENPDSDEAKISSPYISAIERGNKNNITLKSISTIAKLLEIKLRIEIDYR